MSPALVLWLSMGQLLFWFKPDYFSKLLPPRIQETTTYNLRNSDNVQNYRAHSNLFLNSFFPSSFGAWNDLPNDIRNAPSVASFKYKLNWNLNAPPRFYYADSRKGHNLHARLRLEWISLNSDLYMKHIVPSPLCQCGGFESATHFFFTCPIFTNARQRYLPNNLENFTARELLFGKENATEQDNQSLFLQVQNVITRAVQIWMQVAS